MNCQAVCDARGKFLDISIMYPGSTSDCLAFEGMSLYSKLENGVLAPGLCFFVIMRTSTHYSWQRHSLESLEEAKTRTISIIPGSYPD